MKEVAEWMHSMHDVTGKTMLTAIPEDILVYFTQHWLPNHARSSTAGTELIAAPSSLTGIKSHLATQTGSPMHNMQVRNMLKGYANHATELGYQKRGAVPLTQLEMHSSVFQLLIKSTDQAEQVLLARDGLLFSILWQTCYRGFNAGGVRLENIVLPTGGTSLPNLIPKSCQ